MKAIALLFIFVLVMVGIAQAQNTPQPVQDAFADLNQRLGTNYSPNDFSWRWREEVFQNRALGCSNQNTGGLNREDIVGYVVELEVPNRGTWDYRISYNPAIFFLCSPLPTPTPIPANTLAPTPIPLPTNTLGPTFTPSSCGTLPSRLVIGQEARVTPGIPNNLRAQAGSSGTFLGEIPPDGVFFVIDGPRCSVDGAWWFVDYNGLQGWTLEGQNGDYYVEPMSLFSPTAVPTSVEIIPSPTAIPVCNPEMPSRMQVGRSGRVTPGIPNNLRAQAGASGEYLGEIPAEGVFLVLDGPRCAGGMAWWQVNYNGTLGWTAEGVDGDYWIEPEFASFAPLTINNILNVQQLASSQASSLIGMHFDYSDYAVALILAADSGVGQIAASQKFSPAPSWTYTSFGVNDWGRLIAISSSSLVLTDEETLRLGFYRFPDATPIFEVEDIGYQAMISPDENYLLLNDGTSSIQVLDTNTGNTLVILPTGELGTVQDIQFSPDGRYLAVNFGEGFVIWETTSWSSLASSFIDAPYLVKAIAITNESFAFALESPQDNIVFAVPFADINNWQNSGGLRHSGSANNLLIAPDNSFLLIGTDSGVQVGAFPSGELLIANELSLGLETPINSLAMSDDGRFLAVANATSVTIWGITSP